MIMAYFEDLTPYKYMHRSIKPGLIQLNVGWLSRGKNYNQGLSTEAFKGKLFEFCQDYYVINITRGFHVCELCSISESNWYENKSRYGKDHYWLSIGDGEIRTIGDSVIYAAPTLIYHYVVDHRYMPPNEFIKSVLSGPVPGSPEHKAILAELDLG